MIALSDDGEAGSAVYVPKAAGEVEPLLRLWPAALAVPTPMAFEAVDLVELRAFPVHPLGLVAEPSWADGGVRSPAEFFFHDLDHARFKIREDLRVEGIEIPDAYRLGTTLDAETGQHRTILSAAESRVGSLLWGRVESRRELCARLLAFSASLAEPLRTATELLLFEILCEKSLPLDEDVLVHELRSGAHVIKARRKQASGFYGDYASGPAVMAALEEACGVLGESL
ncbi:MAG: hypothetical protein KDD11_23675 [Acidobacteria bacterium]|nr:hypothetical protein [Acidobacteriota bacterium]